MNRGVWGVRLAVALQVGALASWAGGIGVVLAATLGVGASLRDPFGWGTLYGAAATGAMVLALVIGVAGLQRWRTGGGDGLITAFDAIVLAVAAWVMIRGGAGALTVPVTAAYAGLVAIALILALSMRIGDDETRA